MKTELEVLNAVNTFYSQSFSQLITITVAVLAFVGVVMPILFSMYQKRLFKIEHKEIEHKLRITIESEFEEKMAQLNKQRLEELQAQKDEFNVLKNNLDRKFNKLEGALLHVQAVNSNGTVSAYRDFMDSAISYIYGHENLNLRRVMNQIIEDCLPKISVSDFEYATELEGMHNKLLSDLKNYNTDEHYDDLILNLEREFSLARKRTIIPNT